MLKRCVLALLFCVVPLTINGNECGLHAVELEKEEALSIKRWEEFQDGLAWLVPYSNPFKNVPPLEDEEEDRYLREKWDRREKEFADALIRLNVAFWEFHNRVEEAVMTGLGQERYASHAAVQAGFDLTKLYIEFMENELFPENWRELCAKEKTAQQK